MVLGMHMCRGNNRGKWMGSGGYEYVSEVVFRNIDIPNYFMEYDSGPRGRLHAAPARAERQARHPRPHLEQDAGARVEGRPEAAHRRGVEDLPLDQLCLSPQCGFASNFMGNPVTVDDEKRKLSLVVEIANEVWG